MARRPYGDGTLCGVHYHAARRALKKAHRLLVVDDDLDLLETMGEFLESAGFDVTAVTTLDEGARALRQRDHTLAITDWLRPTEEDPWSAIAAFAKSAAPTPVGLVTGHSVSEAEAAARGFSFVVQKPFSLETLLTRVVSFTGQPLAAGDAAMIEAYFAALSNADWDGLARLCSEDVEYDLPGESPKFCTTIRGRSAFRSFSERTFREFPNARFEVERVLPLPEGAIARYRATWTGRVNPVSGSVLFRIQDGHIAQIGVRTDVAALLPRGGD